MRAAEGHTAGRSGIVGLAVAIALASACAAGGNGDEGAGGGGGKSPSGAAGATGGGAGSAGSAGSTAPIAGTVGTAGTVGAAGTTCTGAPIAHMSWSIGRDGNGPAITCDQAGATSVQLFMNAQRSEFTCAAGTGTTGTLTPGMYTPRVLITGSQGAQVLSQGDLPSVTIPSCGNTSLGNVRFVVAATGAAGTGGGAAGTNGGGAGTSGAAGTVGGTGPCNALPIFATHNCTVAMACHDANGAAANFNMASSGWEKMLVGRLPKAGGAAGLGSQCIPGAMPYLRAGSNPASGLFLSKLNKPGCGQQMPLLPPDLTPQELDCVQRWANGLVGIKGF